MLHIPSSEASEAYKLLAPSPLLAVEPGVYFALLTELTEEIGSYDPPSQPPCLQHRQRLAGRTPSPEQAESEPYTSAAEACVGDAPCSQRPELLLTLLAF